MDEENIIKTFRETCGVAIGEASMCWSEDPVGIFESTRALAIVDALVEEHEKDLAKLRAQLSIATKALEEVMMCEGDAITVARVALDEMERV